MLAANALFRPPPSGAAGLLHRSDHRRIGIEKPPLLGCTI
jgi:hypothetical protein